MSAFDSIYSSGVAFLASVSGGEVVYRPVGGAEVVDSGAIVGRETTIQRGGSSVGEVKIRRIEVSLQRSAVNEPLLNAKLVIAGEVWPIKGIVAREATLTRVECELQLATDSSRGGHRPRM